MEAAWQPVNLVSLPSLGIHKTCVSIHVPVQTISTPTEAVLPVLPPLTPPECKAPGGCATSPAQPALRVTTITKMVAVFPPVDPTISPQLSVSTNSAIFNVPPPLTSTLTDLASPPVHPLSLQI
jgi:hypothetical protein